MTAPTIPEIAMVEGGIDHGRRVARGDPADAGMRMHGSANVEEGIPDRLAIHVVIRVFPNPRPAVKSQAVKLGVQNPLAAHHVIRVEQRGRIAVCRIGLVVKREVVLTQDVVWPPGKPTACRVKDKLELTRFRGHLTLWGGGIHDAENETAVSAGLPASDD